MILSQNATTANARWQEVGYQLIPNLSATSRPSTGPRIPFPQRLETLDGVAMPQKA